MKKISGSLIICLLLYGGVSVAGASDWPQWRGPDRNGISRETGILKEWSDGGPRVLWRVPLGEGFSGISVAQGRVYTMFSEEDDEFVICLDASNGEEIWRFRSDSTYYESEGGNGPRATPTVDREFLFTVSAQGKFYALNSMNGEQIWSYDLIRDFNSYMPRWGFSSSPLVEGNMLLVEVGGNNGKFIVAFDKTNGEVLWSSHTDKLGYASPIAVTIGGVRQLIVFAGLRLLAVSTDSGELLWSYPWRTGRFDVHAATPIFIPPDKIFISSAYGKGAAVIQVKVMDSPESDDRIKMEVKEVWMHERMQNRLATSILHGNHLYGFHKTILKCIDANTGTEK